MGTSNRVFLLSIVLGAAGLGGSLVLANRSTGIDFFAFRAVARSVSERPSLPVYSPEARSFMGAEAAAEAFSVHAPPRLSVAAEAVLSANGGALHVVASPALFALARLMSSGSYEHAFRAYAAVTILALVLSVGILASRLELKGPEALLLVAFFAGAFEPFQADLRVGNVSTLVLAGLCLSLAVGGRPGLPRGRRVVAGALLGFCVAVKPLAAGPACLILLLWRPNRNDKLPWPWIGALVGVLAAVGFSLTLFSTPAVWRDWFGVLPAISDGGFPFSSGNFALSRLLEDATGLRVQRVLAVLVTLPAIFLVVSRGPAPQGAESEVWALGAGAAVMLLGSGLSWLHYFVLSVPLLMLAVHRCRPGDRFRGLLVLGAALSGLPSMAEILPGGHLTQAWLLNFFVLALAVATFPRGFTRPPEANAGFPST